VIYLHEKVKTSRTEQNNKLLHLINQQKYLQYVLFDLGNLSSL